MAAYYLLFHFVAGGIGGLDRFLGPGFGLFTVLGISMMVASGDTKLLNGAPTKPPIDGQRVAISGKLETIGDPLLAPFSRSPCIAYNYNIGHSVTSSKGPTRRVPHIAGMALTPSAVRWALGRTKICAYPIAEGYSSVERTDEAWLQSARAYVAATTFEEKPGGAIGEAFSLAGEILTDDDGAMRRDSRFIDDADIAQLHITETMVPVGEEVCLIGHYSAERSAIVADRTQTTRLIRGDRKTVRRMFFWQRIGQFILGVVFAAVPIAATWYLVMVLPRA